jgi:ribulose 1,5-bisphosphate synthetase/thiazole synthase
MTFYPMMLVAWLFMVCRVMGSTISLVSTGAVLLERTSQLRPVYDYVIVGGGTSGLVVANRLTENPKSTHSCLRVVWDADGN